MYRPSKGHLGQVRAIVMPQKVLPNFRGIHLKLSGNSLIQAANFNAEEFMNVIELVDTKVSLSS